MPYYRFYFLDFAGHFDRMHEAMLDDDACAQAEAQRLAEDAVIEIWSQHRRVGTVHPGQHRQRRG